MPAGPSSEAAQHSSSSGISSSNALSARGAYPVAAAAPRARSASPRSSRGRDTFSQPPRGALKLASTPKEERPVGLLGSVLRREAAISALKTAVQTPPPPPGRDRRKLLKEMADTLHELREATVDAVELLAARPPDAARFYWNGMDLVLKMLTDLQWGPFPQTVDPLLWKWFGVWSGIWTAKARSLPAASPELLMVRGDAFLVRCRKAEKLLLRLAEGASKEGAGMGGWASLDVHERTDTLLKVQTYRLTAAHSDGGANHAQKRRFANMELLLYGKEDVHLSHLKALEEHTSTLPERAALLVQHLWRIRKATMELARRANVKLQGSAADHFQHASASLAFVTAEFSGTLSDVKAVPVPPSAKAQMSAAPPAAGSPPRPPALAKEQAAGRAPMSPKEEVGSPDIIDRSYLNQVSMDLPDFA